MGRTWRIAFGPTVKTECGGRIEETVIQDANVKRPRKMSEHRANASGIGDVARQGPEVVDGLLQFAGDACGGRACQHVTGSVALEIGQHIIEPAETSPPRKLRRAKSSKIA
jgi:hypothetical protein